MEEKNPISVELKHCTVVQSLGEGYGTITHEAQKQNVPNDIYVVLGIDETNFRVLVETERPPSYYSEDARK